MAVLPSIRRWLGLKTYQFEVTFGVYMYTPWEKFYFLSLRTGTGPRLLSDITEWPNSSLSLPQEEHRDWLTYSRCLADSLFFLLFGLTFIAAILYLPHHVSILSGRVWYYINGEHVDVAASARKVVEEVTAGILRDGVPTVTQAIVQTEAREL
ncbi:hypothetical protein HJFPF1_11294 [Paramyrothecium foliicola]|nr:hypothetical protein HJFPF1_11294 [Paramyrothecium foliicola]